MSNLVDKRAYNIFYSEKLLEIEGVATPIQYEKFYESRHLSPFYHGGTTKGYVRGLSIKKLFQEIKVSGNFVDETYVLDAGCGQGGLSCYLACKKLNVIGVDISERACAVSNTLAKRLGLKHNISFIAAGLHEIPISDASVDYIVGHAALHHFIKYNKCASELWRILKPGGSGFFADSFGENKIYHLFHNKAKMKRLGDVVLTRQQINQFFQGFEVEIIPTDWFVMLDKLNLKITRKRFDNLLRKISRLYFMIDRRIPSTTSSALFLSGSVVTQIRKPLL